MRIQYLREFLDLASTLNYTESAKRLHITQPALSKHIDAIERQLGVELLTRSATGTSLTSIGRGFVEDARRVVNDFDFARMRVQAKKRSDSTVLRIAYLRDAARRVLMPLNSWFKKYHPEVELHFLSVEYMRLADELRSHAADVIITMDDDARLRSECEAIALYDDAFVVSVAPWHRLAQRESVTLADLEGERLLIPSRAIWPNIRSFIDSRCNARLLENARMMSDVDTLFFMIEAGQGIAVVASHNRYVYGGKLRFLKLDEPDVPTFPVSALWLKESERYEGAARNLELVRRACRKVVRDLAQ